MEISMLLAEQIMAMFLTMAVGYAVVKIGLFRTEDSKVLSNMVVYICSPCIIVNSFQIELTKAMAGRGTVDSDRRGGWCSCRHDGCPSESPGECRCTSTTTLEKASIIYSTPGISLVIPLVASVLGQEWVFYTTAFIVVQTVLLWTHGRGLGKPGGTERL
ncbi:MAG: AEC family transporter [[Clostridium] scindens]